MKNAVEMTGITKRFGTNEANSNVSVSIKQGSIHAIIGENGAGKTTLMRVLYGLISPDSGSINVFGNVVHFKNPNDAIRVGIGMVSQHYSIIPELSCIDNLILGAEGDFLINRESAIHKANEIATQMGFSFEWNSLAETLSPAGAQKLEILKLLWRKAEILILDEPTAMLAPEDSELLFEKLRILSGQGKTVILVTHRLIEVIEHCDRATIMRAGKVVGEIESKDASIEKLAALIVGDESFSVDGGIRNRLNENVPLLEIRNLTVLGDKKNIAVNQLSLTIHKNEIVGIAGVDGSGQRELFQAILGIRKYEGSIKLNGSEIANQSVKERIKCGIKIVPEDRHLEAVIDEWSLKENAILGSQFLEPVSSGVFLSDKESDQRTKRIIQQFNTICSGPNAIMRSLSGGNQQRFGLGRSLEDNPCLLLAFQPTRGLDIRGTQQVYGFLREKSASEDFSVIVISFDLDELLENCDRILVIYDGVVSEPAESDAKNRQVIGKLMTGVTLH